MARADDRVTVLYDDACPMCTFQSRMLGWLDWLNVVRMEPLSGGRAAALAPGLTRAQLMEAIHCVRDDGTIYRGARALRYLGTRLPALLPLTITLYLPGVIQLAERLYMWISRNRHLLSEWFGCAQACSLLPERKPRGDGDKQPRP